MLLDIRKDAESIYSLIAWLETKGARTRYSYAQSHAHPTGGPGCALVQYFSDKFGRPMYVDDTSYGEMIPRMGIPAVGTLRPLPRGFDALAKGGLDPKDWTFGKMLTRARKVVGR